MVSATPHKVHYQCATDVCKTFSTRVCLLTDRLPRSFHLAPDAPAREFRNETRPPRRPHWGQGDSLVPPYTRGSVSMKLHTAQLYIIETQHPPDRQRPSYLFVASSSQKCLDAEPLEAERTVANPVLKTPRLWFQRLTLQYGEPFLKTNFAFNFNCNLRR